MAPRDLAACLTLAEAPRNRPLRVAVVSGDRRLVHRLAALGIVPNATVTLIRRRGTLVLGVGDGRIALGSDAATSIVVEPA